MFSLIYCGAWLKRLDVCVLTTGTLHTERYVGRKKHTPVKASHARSHALSLSLSENEWKEEVMQLKFEYVECFSILLPNVTRLFSS